MGRRRQRRRRRRQSQRLCTHTLAIAALPAVPRKGCNLLSSEPSTSCSRSKVATVNALHGSARGQSPILRNCMSVF